MSNNTIVFERTHAIKYFKIIIEVDRDRLGARQKVRHLPRGGGCRAKKYDKCDKGEGNLTQQQQQQEGSSSVYPSLAHC